MSISLKHEDLARILTDIKQNPDNQDMKMKFLDLIQPIIKVTVDRYPQNMHDDMQQEMKIFIMEKAQYIADAFFSDKIENPTNYIFRVCSNSATNYYKKDSKNLKHLVPIDDVKIEPIYTPKTYQKSKILEEVREQMLDFIKVRYTKRSDQKVAEKFLVALLQGKRPSFMTKNVRKFTGARQEQSKDIYSVVLLKMRELIEPRLDELID